MYFIKQNKTYKNSLIGFLLKLYIGSAIVKTNLRGRLIMKVNAMNDERIAISEIKNIESIKFSDLGVSNLKNNNTSLYNELLDNGNILIKPMLTVAYNGANILVLSSDDENFNYFVKKVRDTYKNEKDKPIEGSILKRHIEIDDLSKKILLSDTITQTSDLYNFYSNIESFNERLISNETEVKAILPLIDYIISSNLSNINKTFRLESGIKGFASSGIYNIYGRINGIYTVIPLRIIKDNNLYYINIGNIFDETNPLEVTINFNKTSLDIISNMKELRYQSLENFKYESGYITNNKEIYVNNKCLYTNPIKYEKLSEEPNISKLDESDTLDWFELPWGATLGFKFEENIIDDKSKTEYRKIQYVDDYDNALINIESAEKRFKRKDKDFRSVKDIIFDDVDKTMVALKDLDCIYIETAFNDNGTVGVYKDLFAGKYFYQFSNTEDFNSINKNNTYPVNREYDVYEPGDLRENIKIRKKVKGN